MHYWNYRIITDGKRHWVGEVYYDRADRAVGYMDSESGTLDDWQSLEELENTIRQVGLALDKPVVFVDEDERIVSC